MNNHYLGIDVAKDKLDVALLIVEKYKHKVFANNIEGFKQLVDWLGKWSINAIDICLEATGNYSEPLAEYLFETGFKVSVINPAQIKAFAQSQLIRNKTDKVDSTLIAQYCQRMQPIAWQPLPKPVRELQALVARLEDLMTLENQERNRLQTAKAIIQPSIRNTLKIIQCEIKTIRKLIKEHINQNPELKNQQDILQTIPGIGDITIAHILAFLSDINRFKNAKKVVAFVGLNPR